MDPYAILGINHDATDEQILKAYRKKARKCHPDKNPDNPEAAAEKFKELQKALELLTDGVSRTAFDLQRKAKEAARKRREELDKETKKFRDQLEEREKKAKLAKTQKNDELNRQNEIKRLRAEGQRLLEEEQERRRQKQKLEAQRVYGAGQTTVKPSSQEKKASLKLSWSTTKSDQPNGGYTPELLREIFSMYGDVTEVMVSSQRKGRGVVEFRTKAAAMLALEKETGLATNPLKLKLMSDHDQSNETPENSTQETQLPYTTQPSSQSALRTERDFESLVLMRLRQAEERKRLIEEMQKEENNDD